LFASIGNFYLLCCETLQEYHSRRHKILAWKNLSNKERKIPWALASETSLYMGVYINDVDYLMM
jgi:hypothetical protein